MNITAARIVLLLAPFSLAGIASADCLTDDSLRSLDLRYEEALRVGDTEFLQQLLAEEYIWVHNLASDKEPKARLIKRLVKPEEIPKSRRSTDIIIHRLQDTAVLSGVSLVEKWNTDGKSWRTLHYQFMRTYVKTADQQCQLLSVQTMKTRTDERNLNSAQ